MRENPIKPFYLLIFLTIIDLIYIMRDYVYSLNNQSPLDWMLNIGSNTTDVFFWFPLIPLIFKLQSRFNLRRLKSYLFLVPLSCVLALIHRLLAVYLGKYLQFVAGVYDLDYYNRIKNYYVAVISGGSISDLMFVWICIGVYMTIDLVKNYQFEQQQNLRMAKELTDSKLLTLQGQLQPHFLFNTLHTVSALMEENTEKAQSVISRLADFLRYSLDYQDRRFVALNDELQFIKSYLEIETERFRDRLKVQFTVNKSLLSAKVPAFILQPLLENAIKHGVNKYTNVNQITISAKKQDLNLIISIEQNGDPVNLENLQNLKGIGISNIKNRLQTIYKSEAAINFVNQNGLIAEIIIPYEELL